MLLGVLGLGGCGSQNVASSLTRTEEACAVRQSGAIVSGTCLRDGQVSHSEADELIQAKTDVLADEVAAGRMTEAQARLELAEYKATHVSKIEREQRDDNLKTIDGLTHLFGDAGTTVKDWRGAVGPVK